MRDSPAARKSDLIADFDLTLVRPGNWTLKAPILIPAAGCWFTRQRGAMAFGLLGAFMAGEKQQHNLSRGHLDKTCAGNKILQIDNPMDY